MNNSLYVDFDEACGVARILASNLNADVSVLKFGNAWLVNPIVDAEVFNNNAELTQNELLVEQDDLIVEDGLDYIYDPHNDNIYEYELFHSRDFELEDWDNI